MLFILAMLSPGNFCFPIYKPINEEANCIQRSRSLSLQSRRHPGPVSQDRDLLP